MIRNAGDQAAALRDDVEGLATTPYLEPVRTVGGFVHDVESGEIDDVICWERAE